jgi:hypothetical protein
MNKQQIYKESKRIVEFMKFPPHTDAVDDRTLAYYVGDVIKADNSHNENEDDIFHPEDMQFHTSWSWLMPVVESCFERLDARDTSADEIKRHLLVCNLKGVHQSVVEFIKTEIIPYFQEQESEYTCDNETCRKYYSGAYNGGLCGSCSDDDE